MPFWKSDGDTGRELSAFRMFDDGKTILDVAQELRISIDKATEYQQKWVRAKSEMQNKAFTLFTAGKDFMNVATELGAKVEVVEELYRTYLKFQKRQEQIKKEISEEDNKNKKYTPPFYVTKLVKNPYTGRGYVIEKCPATYDEPPRNWTEFEAFARNMGDGEYWIMDNDGKKTGRINVTGLGFNDPSELDEMGYSGDGYQRNGRPEHGMRRRIPGSPMGMHPDGMYPQQENPYYQNPEDAMLMGGVGAGSFPPGNPLDREAMRILKQDGRTKELYYRIAEMAYRQGNPVEAAKYLQMAENYGKAPTPLGQEPRKSFIDELVESGSNEKKMEILNKIFGNGNNGGKDKDKEEEETDPEIRKMKMYGDLAKDLIPQVRDSIIDPLMEGITGENRGVGQLEREAFAKPPGSISGGGGWKVERVVRRPQQTMQNPETHIPLDRDEVVDNAVESHSHIKEGFTKVGEIKPKSIKHVATNEIKQRVEMDPLYSGDVDDEIEMKKADDFGQSISKAELEDGAKFTKTEVVGEEVKMGMDEKYMINRGFPKFKNNILEWKAAKDRKDENAERANSPEIIARDDYYMMAKSNYAAFIGKKRLLKAYHTAKKGFDSIVGSYKGFIEKRLMEAATNGMDFAAEKLREMGTDEFGKVWDPPNGMNKKAAMKMLLKYLILKDCWQTFTSDYGKDWFTKYCNEFVKAVDEDYNTDDKRTRIRNILQTGADAPGKGKIIDPGELSPNVNKAKVPKSDTQKVVVKKVVKEIVKEEVIDDGREAEKGDVGKSEKGASGAGASGTGADGAGASGGTDSTENNSTTSPNSDAK